LLKNKLVFLLISITVKKYLFDSTTRKPAKTNGITDGKIPSQNLSVYTDGPYILFGKMQRRGDVEFFSDDFTNGMTRDSN
jgi:hypothetical protein